MNIEVNDFVLTMNHVIKKNPDDRVTLDFIARDDEGSVQIVIHSERGYSSFVTIQQDEKGVHVVVENDERKTKAIPALIWDDSGGE